MQGNPYTTIIEIMREQGAAKNPPAIMLAKVLSSAPNLTIKVGDLQIGKENLLVADHLLSAYTRAFSIEASQVTCSTSNTEVGDHGSHKHSITSMEVLQGSIKTIDTINMGDILAVMPTYDEQTFIILARVVSLK